VAEIVLEEVSKRYEDGTLAVRSVSVTVADGERVILVGPSGCGKSTLLNMIAGLERISSGELRIGGVRMNERAPRERDIAMVFQSYALYPHLTVRENLAFPLRLARTDEATLQRKVEEAAQLLDLGAQLERKPASLSGGQRQRVAMGRAIVRSPKAFLMDEPLSNLDAQLRAQMRLELSRLQRKLGTTTVYVTHDQTEAMTLGDRVVVLRAGEVQQIDAPQALYDRPANLFVAGFIGSPAMALIPAPLTDGTLHTALGEIPLTDRMRALVDRASAPRELILGLRPEKLAAGAHAGGVTYRGQVDVVESLGADKYIYFARTGGELAVRVPAATPVREGDTFEVWFDPDQAQLFDASTGRNLAWPTDCS
jgi:multiple sugar transport system ATP-binding protein